LASGAKPGVALLQQRRTCPGDELKKCIDADEGSLEATTQKESSIVVFNPSMAVFKPSTLASYPSTATSKPSIVPTKPSPTLFKPLANAFKPSPVAFRHLTRMRKGSERKMTHD